MIDYEKEKLICLSRNNFYSNSYFHSNKFNHKLVRLYFLQIKDEFFIRWIVLSSSNLLFIVPIYFAKSLSHTFFRTLATFWIYLILVFPGIFHHPEISVSSYEPLDSMWEISISIYEKIHLILLVDLLGLFFIFLLSSFRNLFFLFLPF